MATDMTTDRNAIVGRGVAEGARLFRDWFNDLTAVAERGDGAAYCFIAGNMIEIMRTFDIPATFPEINALQTAFRNVSRSYLDEAESYGYSPDICGYVKTDVAIQLRGGDHPMGRIPKPKLVLLNNYCNTFVKWGEIWERLYDCPVLGIDYPMIRAAGAPCRPGTEDFAYERNYVRGQIQEIIEVCERITGKRFDIDKFRQILAWSNDMNLGWKKTVELNKNRPAVFNALTDGTVYLGVANALRGTEAGSHYFRKLVEELEYRVEHGIGAFDRNADGSIAPVKQTFRLGLVGTPCYPIYRKFNDMFARWGGIFVYSSYLDFASSGALTGYQYDLGDPLTSYAEGQLVMHSSGMESVFHESTNLGTYSREYALEGVLFHPVKSCRTVSTGMADMRRVVADELGLPTLFLESDVVDPQVVSEAQMRNRADAFFEGLISRSQQKQAALA